MKNILTKITVLVFLLKLSSSFADHHLANEASVIIPKEEVDSTLLQGLANIAEGRTVSDIVVRHIDVGEEHLGVSVVQRDKVEIRETETGIAHVDLDEIITSWQVRAR